jgi:hypothetical protein
MELQAIPTQSSTCYPTVTQLRIDIDKLLHADAVSPRFLKKLNCILSCLDIAATWTSGSEYLDDVQLTIKQTFEELRDAEHLPKAVDQRVFQITNLLASEQIFNQSDKPAARL